MLFWLLPDFINLEDPFIIPRANSRPDMVEYRLREGDNQNYMLKFLDYRATCIQIRLFVLCQTSYLVWRKTAKHVISLKTIELKSSSVSRRRCSEGNIQSFISAVSSKYMISRFQTGPADNLSMGCTFISSENYEYEFSRQI